ncbi:MAG TPA: DUF6491 family protein [Steroidobacteraceae bacterium]|nr:DUF6491 family protein [Steroidobacteraceae bacterium]
MRIPLLPTAVVLALGLMAGCAAAPTRQMFEQYAGPPIESFTYLGHYNGFRTLGGLDVVIWTSINDAYLIRVMPPCVNLPYANRVELTSEAHMVTRSIDWVIVGRDRCRIDTLQHIDYGAMKKAGIAGP